ncbi:MAG: hypothetical protein JSW06_00135 [Thermoplasmatales archaeon]|nr:MAG: hypothetical protein JSW06_00135 [Thermoplasmatales archaeon]
MEKKIVGILVCMLLIATSAIPVAGTVEINKGSEIGSQYMPVLIPHPIYEPEDIDLKDAAFHGSYGRYHGEWWYFEGIFDNGYSIVLGAAICSKGSRGLCILALHIYNDTELEFFLNKGVSFKDFDASEDFPFIKIYGKQIMSLDRERYNSTGEWVYNVTIEIDGQEANLQFIGTTKGYKGEILRGWYGPVLPKATVEGTLILNGDQINVSGLGYHEHGWEIPIPPREWGFYWGKIVSDSFCLFWAKMMRTHWWEQTRAAILSLDQSGYINIKPENFKFKAIRYIFNNRRIIPTKFRLNVSDPDRSIYINATMETLNIHHVGLRIPHYWKYHVRVNGQICYGSSTEIIKDEIQIVELTRFR